MGERKKKRELKSAKCKIETMQKKLTNCVDVHKIPPPPPPHKSSFKKFVATLKKNSELKIKAFQKNQEGKNKQNAKNEKMRKIKADEQKKKAALEKKQMSKMLLKKP